MLTVRHISHWYEPKLPHAVFINGFFAGMMRDHDLRIEAPPGTNSLKVQFGGPLRLGKSGKSIDLVLWIVSWFVTMPPLYKILSNVFFAVWLVRLVVIRKRYYKICCTNP